MLKDLTGVEIDLGKDQVRTPFGVATERSSVDGASDSPLGAWKGTQWRLSNVNQSNQTGTVASFAVGIQTASGRGVIDYDVKSIMGSGKTRLMRILTFPRPPRTARLAR